MSKIIIANWKMNITLASAINMCDGLSLNDKKGSLIIAVPAPYLAKLSQEYLNLSFSAQNVSEFPGYEAKTGEYSASMLKECGVKYAIIGHSERRKFLHEESSHIAQKALNCSQEGVVPIICFGEEIEGDGANYLNFITEMLDPIPLEKLQHYMLAYEPVWAIGTGVSPGSESLMQKFELIKRYLEQRGLANKGKLVYGGSVNLDNVSQILNIPDVDGVLVGGSSLDIVELSVIARSA